jgi:hypothetical protein
MHCLLSTRIWLVLLLHLLYFSLYFFQIVSVSFFRILLSSYLQKWFWQCTPLWGHPYINGAFRALHFLLKFFNAEQTKWHKVPVFLSKIFAAARLRFFRFCWIDLTACLFLAWSQGECKTFSNTSAFLLAIFALFPVLFWAPKLAC